jgi:uncharacterized membrane protein YhhN
MTDLAWWLIGATVVLAACDWVAVGIGNRSMELVFKPATMLPLIAAAVVLEPYSSSNRAWFVVGLVCSLAGDVCLMLDDRDERLFVAGLASFLVGHLAYIAGLAAAGVEGGPLAVGAAVVLVLIVAVAPRIVRGARRTDPALGLPVLVYIMAISVMVAFAIGSTVPVAILGAGLFYVSDFTIGWSRFITAFPGHRLVIITTYHAAQIFLVLSLAVTR